MYGADAKFYCIYNIRTDTYRYTRRFVKFYLDLAYLHRKRRPDLHVWASRRGKEYIEILYRPVSTYPAMHNKYQDDFHHPIPWLSVCTNRGLRPFSRDPHCIIWRAVALPADFPYVNKDKIVLE